ncbi:MAG: tungstate ABC transporter substrate-binding protein WtpA [Candidatus Methanofastidiosa archaeon]|nr:tungstate ABC transporter substrate-binding protein WtpA [Candidatus Methanofastidiosa archaeon]
MILMISICLLLVAPLFSGCISSDEKEEEPEPVTLKVLHAGSLTSPFEKIEAEFEADYPYVDVQLEPAGSVACVNKIIETGIEADILASADYTLIPSMMMPDYADWYILFASNEMVLTYSENSKYADEIDADNWYDILRRDDVLWAFSNPNLDPCGYRTPMVIQLAEAAYGDDQIFEDLIESYSSIYAEEQSGNYIITTPEDLAPDTDHLTIRDKSVDLVSMVLEGGLDYAWEYISVAVQNGLDYVRLPKSINLSSVAYADDYNKVSVVTCDGKSKSANPIVYGVTVPLNAPNSDVAALFIEYIINEVGQGIFELDGQPPMVPAGVNDIELVPETLKEYLEQI